MKVYVKKLKSIKECDCTGIPTGAVGMGNPDPGTLDGFGSGDRWDSGFKMAVQAAPKRKAKKRKQVKIKRKK